MALHPALAARIPLRPDPAATARLWAAFRQSGDAGVRGQLIGAYMSFARVMAAKAYARRPSDYARPGSSCLEFDDYLQYANLGLLEAIDRFDPERGIKFETFAACRITGAVLTGLASASEISSQLAARRRVNSERAAALGQTPAPDGPEAVFALLADIALSLAVGFALEESSMYAQQEGTYADTTYAALELKQLKSRVNAALGSLAPSQRRVMQSHYLQHMSFEDVAASMSISRSRVGQLHREALDKLRSLLKRNQKMDLYC